VSARLTCHHHHGPLAVVGDGESPVQRAWCRRRAAVISPHGGSGRDSASRPTRNTLGTHITPPHRNHLCGQPTPAYPPLAAHHVLRSGIDRTGNECLPYVQGVQAY
jgi:hypothetical protein